jgi:hypothetical protein
MSGELGLKNSFRRRVYEPLRSFRGSDGAPGQEASLIDFMQTRAVNEDGRPLGLRNTAGKPITWDDIWCDMGMDPSNLTLDHLLGSEDDMRYLTPELIREFIYLGVSADQNYMDLVAGTETANSLTVTSPWIYTAPDLNLGVGEGETIPESDIEWGDKTVRLKKKARMLTVSDELILSTPISLLSYFLQRFGTMLAASLYVDGVNTLINGDQPSGDDACGVVGVGNTTTGIAFSDFIRMWIRSRRLFMNWTSLVTNEVTGYDVMNIHEFLYPQGYGTPLIRLDSKNRYVPPDMPHLIGAPLADGQCMLFDKSQAMIYLSFRGLLVENERIMMRQINGTSCSTIGGFITVNRLGRCIMDKTLAFSSNGFPSWMAPLI